MELGESRGEAEQSIVPRSGHIARWFAPSEVSMPHYVGLDVSQKTTAICVVDEQGKRLWRGVCATDPGPISARISQHAGVDAKVGIKTGSMTPWLVHGLRAAGLDVACLDARRVKAALQMQLNKTDQNDAEGLAQIMRTGWYRAVHVSPSTRIVPGRSLELAPSLWV